VLTITAPAPSGAKPVGSGVRPQTRFTYGTRTARFKNPQTGDWVTGTPVHVPLTSSSCATASSCANGADETRTTIAWPAAGTPNNLQPVSITTAAGNGAVSATTSFTYSPWGGVLTVDGPLPGAG